MSTTPANLDSARRRSLIAAFPGCAVVFGGVAVVFRATADRNQEQTLKDRVRIETLLGSEKEHVLSWIGHNCKFLPQVDTAGEDTLNAIPIVDLARLEGTAISSYARTTVCHRDAAAREKSHEDLLLI